MKSIGVIGTGFVGTAVLEGMRHAFEVVSYDKKTGAAVNGESASFVSDDPYSVVLSNSDGLVFVCVPTPMNKDGSIDTGIVESVVHELNRAAGIKYSDKTKKRPTVCIKSTVVPGTSHRLDQECEFINVCFNPEFLTERTSIEDFKNQDRIIIGGPREGTSVLKQVYSTAYPDVPITKTNSQTAEMVKYTTNVFLACKVAVANELKQVCDHLNDVDYDKVIEYATKDKRLGKSHWAVPGPDGKLGFGGSCFPKDLNALMHLANELGVNTTMMGAAWNKNLEVRPEEDWLELKGRAVNYE